MIKTVILVSHPEIKNSAQQQFFKTVAQNVTNVRRKVIDDLYDYNKLDIVTEQDELKKADRIIFQFPLYWYQAPGSLSRYITDVITRKFAISQEQLKGKELGVVVSIGDALSQYQAGGSEQFTISELMAPYRAFAHKAQMKFLPVMVVDQFAYMDENQKSDLVAQYLMYLEARMPLSLESRTEWLLDKLTTIGSESADNKKATDLIASVLETRRDQIDDLKENIKLMRDEEE
ncbi:NAD(P)H-dependent oxidoreductase [Lentilactobacillus sp. Marseille-Q4993]|uniref:NAD(P)H-dependent oxidoreductase n=1 Tax=Lentilactobacillus sp. Marseille-Q4993 TaxID=3039492 RepID=UPI0024BD0D22|nr:NAD(P)H-dependent oxidoreductase [Lentilactobacillus sp. Marseille-Q4993]